MRVGSRAGVWRHYFYRERLTQGGELIPRLDVTT